ncbi:hypothetical protein VOLCADRAFT_86098 [Volvox carteri f. nagariensis]|uniref:Uncharacterized protein n=1 Tax=Volvox carteri f. nagariensis TaxID=3068 RepID=D8THV2_VOLCA|nr:uncharacterized protein VOLCADRAFT_86098 [Volvox carteri f. nagariensis]EFJ52782.1 hypothetical protein VOLCADRAFT_86098 [Volvox carteri f. nagariensis]|eukprot:XP_002945787.1 hypothetical protein VOLCADRAFT_86098 [Volvox carteri f. nagariensis]
MDLYSSMEPSPLPVKPPAPEKILNEAWSRHADSKSNVGSKPRKPAAYRPHVGLSRFQYGDGEYLASVANFQQYHEPIKSEIEPLPEMLELVQTTRTMARTARAGFAAGSGGGGSKPPSLESLRRRHSACDRHISRIQASDSGEGGEDEEADVEEFGMKSDGADDSGRATAASTGSSDTDDSDCGAGRRYGRPAAAAAVPIRATRRRQSTPTNLGIPGLENHSRPAVLPARLSSVESIPVQNEYVSGAGAADDASTEPSARQGVLSPLEPTAPGRRRSSSGVSGSGAAALSVSRAAAAARRSALCATPTAAEAPNASAGAAGAAATPAFTSPTHDTHPTPAVADVVQLDRVSQMLHDLRRAKCHEPSTATSTSTSAAVGPLGSNTRQPSRKQRSGAATGPNETSNGAASASGGVSGGMRDRRRNGVRQGGATGTGDASFDSGPRPFAATTITTTTATTAATSRRESRTNLTSLSQSQLQHQQLSLPLTSVSTSGEAAAAVPPPSLQQQRTRRVGSEYWNSETSLLDFTEDDLTSSMATGTAAAAATTTTTVRSGGCARYPSSSGAAAEPPPPPPPPPHPSSCWPSRMPPLMSAVAGELADAAMDAATAAVAGPATAKAVAVMATAAPAARSPVVPFRSRSQATVNLHQSYNQQPRPQQQSPPPAPRVSGGAPLGGWTCRQSMQRNMGGQTDTASGSDAATTVTAVTAFLHSVHFAADICSFSRGRSSENSLGSFSGGGAAEDGGGGGGGGGSAPNSGASSYRFQRAASGGSTSSGGGGGGGGAGALVTVSSENIIGHISPRMSDPQSAATVATAGGGGGGGGVSRPMSRLFGGLFPGNGGGAGGAGQR